MQRLLLLCLHSVCHGNDFQRVLHCGTNTWWDSYTFCHSILVLIDVSIFFQLLSTHQQRSVTWRLSLGPLGWVFLVLCCHGCSSTLMIGSCFKMSYLFYPSMYCCLLCEFTWIPCSMELFVCKYIYCRFVFESISWLLVKGKIDRVIPIIKSIAKTNGVELSEEACRILEVVWVIFKVMSSNKTMTLIA